MHAERAERVEGSLAPLAWVAAVGVRRGRARVARAPASRAGRAQHLAAVGTRAFTRCLFRIALTPRTAPRPAVAKAPVATEARDVVKSLAATTISGDRRASDGNQMAIRGPQRAIGGQWQSDGNQMAIRGPQRTIGGHQMAINCNQHVHYLSHRSPGCCQKGSAHLSHTYSPCSFFGGGPVCPARKREAQAEHRVRGPSGPKTSPRARDQSHSERPSMILSGQPQAITPGFLPLVSWAWHSHQLQRHAPPSQSRECTPSARNVSKVRSHRSHG